MITIVVMIIEVFAMLSVNAEVAGCVPSRAIDGVETKVSAIGTTIAGPTPSSQMGRITARAGSIGGSGASGKNGSTTPLKQMERRRSTIPGIDGFGGITI